MTKSQAGPQHAPAERLVGGFLFLGAALLGFALVPLNGIKLLGIEVPLNQELLQSLVLGGLVTLVLASALASKAAGGISQGLGLVRGLASSYLPFGGAAGFVGGFAMSALFKGDAIWTALTVAYAAAVIYIYLSARKP